jgi:3-hydroxymyristoyl/3-hydroxydecanoyl-(acyl carrier protein) dehydratase
MFSDDIVYESEQARAQFHVSGSDAFVLGHYPSDAIFPGVMSLRCMQTLSQHFYRELTQASHGEIDLKRITFISEIRPGDVLNILCKIKKKTDSEIQFETNIVVDEDIKTRAVFVYSHN